MGTQDEGGVPEKTKPSERHLGQDHVDNGLNERITGSLNQLDETRVQLPSSCRIDLRNQLGGHHADWD